MSDKIKISAVSYMNTLPFLYGINNYKNLPDISFEQNIPSLCAKKLINDEVDIALIPVAALPHVKNPYIISDFCIGAVNKVHTVLLLSDVPVSKIKNIFLDYQSRTSVNLVKVLAEKHWGISPNWIDAIVGFEEEIKETTAGVVIGDRAFAMQNKFSYKYDLSEEWYKMTKMPFVFAAWVANKPIDKGFLSVFNKALKFGVKNINAVVKEFNNQNNKPDIDIEVYLKKNISFVLDKDKKQSMVQFFDYLYDLDLIPKFAVSKYFI